MVFLFWESIGEYSYTDYQHTGPQHDFFMVRLSSGEGVVTAVVTQNGVSKIFLLDMIEMRNKRENESLMAGRNYGRAGKWGEVRTQ